MSVLIDTPHNKKYKRCVDPDARADASNLRHNCSLIEQTSFLWYKTHMAVVIIKMDMIYFSPYIYFVSNEAPG